MFHSAVMLKLHYHFKLSILDQGGLNTENNGSQSQEHYDKLMHKLGLLINEIICFIFRPLDTFALLI